MVNNIEINDRKFYHSFPRVRKEVSKEEVIKCGLEILKSIRDIGLILAPEIIDWNQPTIEGRDREIKIKQVRISFTELSSSEINKHSEKFGSFAIEFNIDALRKLGAVPVIYLPQHLKDDNNFSAIGSIIVAELNDIKYTINQLHNLSQFSKPENLLKLLPDVKVVSEDCVIKMQNTNEKNEIGHSYEVPIKNINDILSYIGYRNSPFDLMIGSLTFVQNLLCKTDDDKHDSLLEYYGQREWRLLPGIVKGGKSQTRSLTDFEKKKSYKYRFKLLE